MKYRLAVYLVLSAAALAVSGCQFFGLGGPATPTGLKTASPTRSSLVVSWNASSGASSYQVYRATSPKGPWAGQTAHYSGSSTSFTDTGLSANTTYYYEVQATKSGNVSALSSAVEGITVANVYIAGSVGATSSTVTPVSWENGSLSQLTMGGGDGYGVANFVAEDSSGNVYITGCMGSSSTSSQMTPVLWENGSPISMISTGTGTTGLADGVEVDLYVTSVPYVAGWTNATGDPTTSPQIPAEWNGSSGGLYSQLPLNQTDWNYGRAWDPAVDPVTGEFYAAGYLGWIDTSTGTVYTQQTTGVNGTTTPVYWAGNGAFGSGSVQPLSTGVYPGGQARVIVFDGSGTLYVGGALGNGTGGTTLAPFYWKGNTPYSLIPSGQGLSSGAVLAGTSDSAGNVYFAGSVGDSTSSLLDAVYWENGTMYELPRGNGNSYAEATGIAVDALGNVWISNNVGATSNLGTPVYWENGTIQTLSTATSGTTNAYGAAGGITVGK